MIVSRPAEARTECEHLGRIVLERTGRVWRVWCTSCGAIVKEWAAERGRAA